MSIEHKVQNETGRNPYRIGTNVLLLVAFFLLFHPLLSKGSLMYQPTISHWLTAGAFVPLVLRPWRRNHPFAENHTRLYAAVLLVHDVLLFLSAAAVSLILVEYMVKGCVITLKQSFFQGWICYVAVYAAAYLICGNVRIGVCLGMAISMIHGMIDHYVMLFRGTPVMLSDIAAIGTAANVSKGYSAPMELSVLRAAAAAVLFCVSVSLMQRSFKVHKRWYFRRLFSLPCVLVLAFIAYTGIQTVGTGLAFWQSSRQYSEIFYFLRCATSSFVKQPEGYSADALSAAQSEFTGKQGTKTPNLIVIMNESFSDLGSVGALETNEDPMPYVHRLMQGQENTIGGQLTVFRHRAAAPPTPSWSSSTGDSMAFLPYYCSAYQVFIKSEMPNLTSESPFIWLPDGGDSPLSVHLVETRTSTVISSALKRSIIRTNLPLTPVVCAIISATAQATRRFFRAVREQEGKHAAVRVQRNDAEPRRLRLGRRRLLRQAHLPHR